MANISRCFEQFHDFNNSMFFQEKKGKVEVTIYDMASKIIHSSQVSEDILDGRVSDEEKKEGIKTNISKLLDIGYKPKFDEVLRRVFLISPTEHEVDYSSVKKSIGEAIAFIEPKVSLEASESPHYTCPITRTLLKDPVVDDHGHTFEKESIENWLKTRGICPIEGKPMSLSDLRPNITLKNIMERLRKTQFAVPTINLFEGSSLSHAKILLAQGKTCEDKGLYDDALDSYRKALKYTNKARNYIHIPVVLEKKGDSLSASLAYLYLAKYQIQEKQYENALASLVKARDLDPTDIELNKPIALFYKEKGRDKEAFDLFMQIGDRFAKTGDAMALMSAIEAYKNAISVNQDIYEVYLRLADLIQDKQQKANVFLTAANHFMKKDAALAEKFAMEASKLNPDNPLNYFPYIQVLKKQEKIDELVEAFLNLSNVYKRIKDKKNKRLCLREVVELKPSGQIYEKITKSYLKSGKNEKSLQYFLKWIDFNISEKRW
nr:E3 ubiquitin-protein ligase LubX [Candidatus Anoxychlamydiales bacterium]